MTEPQTSPVCVNGCRDDDRNPVRPYPGWHVCDECHRRLRRWLADIPVLYALLPYVLERGSVDPGPEAGGKKPGKASAPPMPMRPAVADLRDERREGRADEARGTLGIVEAWARQLREERNMYQPPLHAITVVSETMLLLKHSDWICQQEWVEPCMREIGREHRTLSHACGEHGYAPVATCHTQIGDTECGGPIIPTKVGMSARCAKCSRFWGENELTRLGLVEAS